MVMMTMMVMTDDDDDDGDDDDDDADDDDDDGGDDDDDDDGDDDVDVDDHDDDDTLSMIHTMSYCTHTRCEVQSIPVRQSEARTGVNPPWYNYTFYILTLTFYFISQYALATQVKM